MSQYNARLIEKSIFTLGPSEIGDSEVIDLFKYGGPSKFSCQAIYDVSTPSATTFDSGVANVQTGNFPAKAGATAGDYYVINGQDGSVWAAALNVAGTDPAPTGAAWVAIASANKTNVNISAVTTAAQVATAVKTALNLLVGFSTIITASDASADGHLALTQAVRGTTTANTRHNANDSGNGSITTVNTTAGVNSEVDVTANTLAIPAHAYPTGFEVQLTTTGTLPAGLSLLTNYFVIVVDANTIKLASSLANAVLGTPVDITGQGSSGAVNTVTGVALGGATVAFYKSNDATNWVLIQSATTISADGSVLLEQPNVSYRYFKAIKALTAGDVDLSALILVIGDAV